MQFAGGRSVADVAALWERDEQWVLDAIRAAILASVPVRDGGTKTPRSIERAARSGSMAVEQGELFEDG